MAEEECKNRQVVACLRCGSQLEIDDVVCCKVLNDFAGDAGDDGVRCCDTMDDSKELKALRQSPVPCTGLKTWASDAFKAVDGGLVVSTPLSTSRSRFGSMPFPSASSLQGSRVHQQKVLKA